VIKKILLQGRTGRPLRRWHLYRKLSKMRKEVICAFGEKTLEKANSKFKNPTGMLTEMVRYHQVHFPKRTRSI
jgi:hypothetical protein